MINGYGMNLIPCTIWTIKVHDAFILGFDETNNKTLI